MEEKVIVKGDFSQFNSMATIFFGMAAVSMLIAVILNGGDDSFVEAYIAPSSGEGRAVFFYLAVIMAIVGVVFLIRCSFCEITVTNKRVYGKAAFLKMVDLPLDKISSVGASFPQGVLVATSSGVIRFYLLNNQEAVYNAISKLLQDRQSASNKHDMQSFSNADELKKYKELLDSGVITQEEFDLKKTQILGL